MQRVGGANRAIPADTGQFVARVEADGVLRQTPQGGVVGAVVAGAKADDIGCAGVEQGLPALAEQLSLGRDGQLVTVGDGLARDAREVEKLQVLGVEMELRLMAAIDDGAHHVPKFRSAVGQARKKRLQEEDPLETMLIEPRDDLP